MQGNAPGILQNHLKKIGVPQVDHFFTREFESSKILDFDFQGHYTQNKSERKKKNNESEPSIFSVFYFLYFEGVFEGCERERFSGAWWVAVHDSSKKAHDLCVPRHPFVEFLRGGVTGEP